VVLYCQPKENIQISTSIEVSVDESQAGAHMTDSNPSSSSNRGISGINAVQGDPLKI
jgi:hypothetical protein